MTKNILALVITLFVYGCGSDTPSESEIVAEFEVAVELSRDCEIDEQCVIVSPGQVVVGVRITLS